jgi:hypothetical protein
MNTVVCVLSPSSTRICVLVLVIREKTQGTHFPCWFRACGTLIRRIQMLPIDDREYMHRYIDVPVHVKIYMIHVASL